MEERGEGKESGDHKKRVEEKKGEGSGHEGGKQEEGEEGTSAGVQGETGLGSEEEAKEQKPKEQT